MMKLMSQAEISTSLALSATEESPTARTQRIAREARDIEAARVSLRAGRFVEADKVHAWIDSLGTENELPIPVSDN